MTSLTLPPPPGQALARAPTTRTAWGVAVAWTLLVMLLGAIGTLAQLASYREGVLSTAGVRLHAVTDTVSISFGQWSALPRSVAHTPDVIDFLTESKHPELDGLSSDEQLARFTSFAKLASVTQMSRYAQTISADFDLPFIGLLDTRGRLLAGSANADTPPAPMSLQSRAYFRQAMVQGKGTQFLLGRVSGVPGMYFAHRVERDGKPVGVVAVKQDAEVINRLLADTRGNIIALADDRGVIVLGNRPELILRRLPWAPAPDEEHSQEVYQRQPEPLQWLTRSEEISGRPASVVAVGGHDHIAESLPLPGLSMTAWVLAPLEGGAAIRNRAIGGAAAVWLFGCALMWFIWRRLQLLEQAVRAQRLAGEHHAARQWSEQRFEAVFQHASAGYIFFDPQAGITECNPATLRLFGAHDSSQLLGRAPWFAPLSPELQASGESSRSRARVLMGTHTRSRERVQACEWRFCRLDGTPFDCDVAVIALEWESSGKFCAVIQDITLRKQTETAMQEARNAAEAASRTKSSFLANMSHELRTPMNAIIGMTHLALDDGLPPRQRDYVQKAHASAQSLLQILNDILDVSKIEAGQLQLERIEFDVDAVVSDMADLLGLKAEEKGLELLFEAAPDLPRRLVGDPMRLRQVLVNLGSNAIKFTDRGEVTVGLEVVATTGTEEVELHGWVRDTGVGITADELTRLFQPFMQADSSTTRRFGGTGLGLVICKQLVERMDGRLWVDSQPGRGSTFHFSARFGRGDPSTPERAWTAAELRGKRALLVDDNAAALDVLGGMLQALGVVVERASSGPQALQVIAEQPGAFTWILLDWKMPGMDGVACARLILNRHPGERPCILLVTAFGRDDALRASADLPLAGVLQKPVTPSSLHDCLLKARTAAPPPTPTPARVPLGEETRSRLNGARILLVEDHPLNRELACELLRRAGMQVVTADNGQEALEQLVQSGPFDGVLMDCQMPVMDGYTATRLLRANAEWQRLPVIAMTASALAEDRERALASGMNAHITKPIDVALMLQTMAAWITAAPSTSAGPSTDPPAAFGVTAASGVASAIDTADGLTRCMGRLDLYQRVLRGFLDAEGSYGTQVREALDDRRWDDARGRTHDLKGLAGTIGALRLQQLAAALHGSLVRRDLADAEVALARVRSELDTVLGEIRTLLPS